MSQRHVHTIIRTPTATTTEKIFSPSTWPSTTEVLTRSPAAGRLFYLIGADHDCLSAHGLLHAVPDLAERDVYLCASPRMSATVRTSVREAGLPAEYLHEERFAF